MDDPARILYVDDEPALCQISRRFLERTGTFAVTTAGSAREALDLLDRESFDGVVSDYQMPDMDGIQLLIEVRHRFGSLPFVLFTGRGREEVAVQAIKNGVDFYLQKGGDPAAQYAELRHVLTMALEQRTAARSFRASELRFRSLIQHSSDIIRILDTDGLITYESDSSTRILGYPPGQTLGASPFDFIHPDDQERVRHDLNEVYHRTNPGSSTGFRMRTADGSYISVESTARNMLGVPGVDGIVTTTRPIEDRRRVEEALRSSEEEHRWLLESMINAFVIYESVFDDGGIFVSCRFQYCNAACERTIDLRLGDVVKKTVHEVWPATEPIWIEHFMTVAMTGEPREFELFHSPTTKWYHCYAYRPWPTPDRFCVVFEDISERRTILEALRQSEQNFHSMFENHDLVMMLIDPESGSIRDANLAAEEFYGYSREMLRTMRIEEINALPPATVAEEREKALERQSITFTFPHRLANGTIRTVEVHSTPIGMGGKPLLFSIIQDITDRLEAQAALSETGKRLSLALEGGELGTWDWHVSSGDVVHDERWMRMVGSPEGAIRSTPTAWSDLVLPDDLPAVRRAIADHLEGRNPVYEAEYRLRRQDGAIIWILDRGKAIEWDSEGRPIRVAGTVMEITAKRQAEETLRQVNRTLNLLNAITRHDISNELVVLEGHLDLLRDRPSEPQYTNSLQALGEAVQRIVDMIRFTRTFEQIGEGAPVWQEVRLLVEAAAGGHSSAHVRIENALPAGLEVLGDPLIARVFVNLVDNALRHGGMLTTIRFSARQRGNDLVVFCEDDGEGVPEAEKERIFERGFGKNTGLGLYLSREVLDRTGIAIRETGEEGSGARFEVTVPSGAFRSPGSEP